MYKQVSKLIVYRDLGADSILNRLASIFEDFDWYKENVVGNSSAFSASKLEELRDKKHISKESLITRIYGEMKRLLDLATDYGFDKNLWHNYLTFLLMTNENSFTLTSEKVGANEGSVNHFAKNDFKIFKELFDYNFYEIEKELGIDCFSTISNYQAIVKKERMYNYNVSAKVQALSERLEQCKDEEGFFKEVTQFYADYGVGMFGLNKAFRIRPVAGAITSEDNTPAAGTVDIYPINNTENVVLDDLVGYEIQKKKLIDNTEAFVEGRPAANTLLCGDAGTGKSSTVKAVANAFFDKGVRLIELRKDQLALLPLVMGKISGNPLKFIIFIDDLSFNQNDDNFSMLKAALEGSASAKAENAVIYATSNRRHIVKESFADREGDDVHINDTLQETLSLSERFGLVVSFSKPSKALYLEIVKQLAEKYGVKTDETQLFIQAEAFALKKGSRSARCAEQFIDSLL